MYSCERGGGMEVRGKGGEGNPGSYPLNSIVNSRFINSKTIRTREYS